MEAYKSLVNHVFLPPELSRAGDTVGINIFTVPTLKTLAALKRLSPPDRHGPIAQMVVNLRRMQRSHINNAANEERLVELLTELPQQGGTLPLHIAAQNAGVLVSMFDLSTIRFEVFELSPSNAAIYRVQGRLRRSFPGSAVDVNLDTFETAGFITVVARTLAKLSAQPAPGMLPKV